MDINALKFYDYANQSRNNLLKLALDLNKTIQTPWYNNIDNLFQDTEFDTNKLIRKYYSDDNLLCKNITKKNNNLIKKVCGKHLINKFELKWNEEINSSSKMKFYKNFKTKPEVSKYLLCVESRKHRTALTRLIVSAHKLKIETGRYAGKNNRIEQSMRTCDHCKNNSKQIDR